MGSYVHIYHRVVGSPKPHHQPKDGAFHFSPVRFRMVTSCLVFAVGCRDDMKLTHSECSCAGKPGFLGKGALMLCAACVLRRPGKAGAQQGWGAQGLTPDGEERR